MRSRPLTLLCLILLLCAGIAFTWFAQRQPIRKALHRQADLHDSAEAELPELAEAAEPATESTHREPAQETASTPQDPPRVSTSVTAPAPIPSFWCRFIEAQDGAPIEGVLVRDHNFKSAQPGRSKVLSESGTTDANGMVELRVGNHEFGVLRTEAPGYGPIAMNVSTEHSREENPRVIVLERSATLDIRVENVDGSALVGARVLLEVPVYAVARPAGSRVGSLTKLIWQRTVDDQGRCVIENLPPQVAIEAQATLAGKRLHKEAEGITLQPGDRSEITWTIGGGIVVSGTLADQYASPIVNRELWLTRSAGNASSERERIYFVSYDGASAIAKTRTDSFGRFQFTDVPEGRWYVGPSAEDPTGQDQDPQAVAPLAVAIETAEGSPLTDLNLVVHRGLYITGRVIRLDGQPVSMCQMRIRTELGDFSVFARGDKFQVGPLEPIEHRVCEVGLGECTRESTVSAQVGDDIRFEIGERASLAGSFIDASTGKPVMARLVTTHQETGRATFGSMRGLSTFLESDLEPGTYQLVAFTEDGRVGVLTGIALAAGESLADLTIQLFPGTTLRVSHTNEQLHAGCRFYLNGHLIAVESLAPGIPVVVTVPAGEITLKVSLERKVIAKRTVLCNPGDDLEVVFEDF